MRRVRPPKSTDKVAERLVDVGPFNSKQKLLMFAAVLGKKRDERTSFDKTADGIRWEIFQRNGDDSFIFALAIAETEGLDVFDDEDFDQGISIFEEYACTGLKRLQEEVVESPGKDREKVVNFISEVQKRQPESDGLEALDERDLDVMGL